MASESVTIGEAAGFSREYLDYLIEWDRWFDSGFLQRKVECEPNSLIRAALCNDEAVLGPWINGRSLNVFTGRIGDAIHHLDRVGSLP